MSKRLRFASVFCLVTIFFVMVIFSMQTKAPTADELAHHVASGYSYLVTGDFRMNPASPPLPRMLAAAPLLFLKAKAPLDHVSWEKGNSPEFARQFFYVKNHRADDFIFWARVPIAFLSVFFALCVYWATRQIVGTLPAIFSLMLYCFCPDIIAHSGLATADLCVALFFFIAIVRFRKYVIKPTQRNLYLTALFTGLALLSKFSAVLLLPIFLIIGILSGNGKKIVFSKIALFSLVAFMTVWVGYFFECKPLLRNTPDPSKKIEFLNKLGGQKLVELSSAIPIPCATFISAVGSMAFTRVKGTNAYLLGEWSTQGWWYYYFVAFFIKNTVPFLILIVLSFIFMKKLGMDKLTRLTILVPIAFFFLVTLRDKAQAGIRYFLPVYPFFFMLAGLAAADLWARKKRLFKWFVVLLLSWHAAESAFIFPDYLAYFNELVGGPANGYKFLRDSNVDWGQDLKGLGEYVQKEGYPEVVLLYYGSADPAYYKIPVRQMQQDEFEKPRKTVYALAAHHIDSARWYKDYRPTKVLGHSIFVYDLRK